MSQENVDLVRSIYGAWERDDYSSLDWAHPQMEYVIADGPSPGSWSGIDGMVEGFREVLSAWEDWSVLADDYLGLSGNRVLVSFHCTGRGKTSGVDLSLLNVNGATLFELDNAKVTRIVQYFERDHALADLGLAELVAHRGPPLAGGWPAPGSLISVNSAPCPAPEPEAPPPRPRRTNAIATATAAPAIGPAT